MPVPGGDLRAREPGALHAPAGLCGVFNESFDLAHLQGSGHTAAQIVGQGRGRHGAEHTARHMAPAPGVLNLPNQTAVVAFNRLRPAAQAVMGLVMPGRNALRALVLGNANGLGDDHGRTPCGAGAVVIQQALRHTVFSAKVQRDGRVHDAVLQRPASQGKRRKQVRIVFVDRCEW